MTCRHYVFVRYIKTAIPISILFGASILTYSSAGQHPRLYVDEWMGAKANFVQILQQSPIPHYVHASGNDRASKTT